MIPELPVFLYKSGIYHFKGENNLALKFASRALEEKLKNPQKNNLSEIEAEAFRFLISTLHYQNKWRSLNKNDDFEYSPNIEELALIIRRIKNRENYLPYPLTGNWADKLIQLEISYKNENKELSLWNEIERKLKNEFVPKWLKLKINLC